MLRFLFPRLTAAPELGEPMFAAVTAAARDPSWYSEGCVPDTLDGRFRVLATLVALTIVRLERDDADGEAASVALTERFIAVMESEHRELGLGDPTLGRTVRKLVGSLARRVDLWRSAVGGTSTWRSAVSHSLYQGADGDQGFAADALQSYWSRLQQAPLEAIVEGRIG